MLWPTLPAALKLTLLGKSKFSYIRSPSKLLGFKKVTPSRGSFFDLLGFDWFESWETTALKCTSYVGNYPNYNNHNNLPSMLYSLKIFKCMFTTANCHTNDLPKTEHQKGTKRKANLKIVTLKSWPMNTTEIKKKKGVWGG